MSRRDSPLRYPGGKACLTDQVIEILKLNNLIQKEYAEPFAGGCGLALGLLYKGYVSKIHLNDYDEAIWSFWYSVLNETDRFISKIKDTQVTLTEWQKQKSILNSTDKTQPLELGFATFFLNRTNRSGISQRLIWGCAMWTSARWIWQVVSYFNKIFFSYFSYLIPSHIIKRANFSCTNK